ncbi:hypothetical protein MIMGU_mgv1a024215mg [Erythranthe guttata]|uniref:RING-type E3 ubiquitin transferase n=1 Tax=Erythranthe guttata TaxID=4155 RepID=A0A022QWG4_ERYGU|nr:hypothetical protein MIMGU_mgv1a024215mg [Erythranthe guttata]
MTSRGIHKFFIFLFLSLVHGQDYCPASYCDKNGLNSPKTVSHMFNIRCGGQKKTILNIPYSGNFNATSIDYYSKRVSLSDPGNCLPRRLLNLNLSSSPFMAVYYQSYTFLSCPKGLASSRYVVDCLSNTTTDIVAANYETDVWLFTKCKIIVTLPLPVSSSYISRFPVDLELTWKVPPTATDLS